MQVTTCRLLVFILLAQAGCLAVGMSFHHLYISSALVRTEEEQARGELSRQLGLLASSPDQQRLASLQVDRNAWAKLLARWRTAAGSADSLFLLDRHGSVVVADDDSTAPLPSANSPRSLTLLRASADWGQFEVRIRGMVKDADGHYRVAVAYGLSSREGYLLATRALGNDKVSAADVRRTLWAADCIAFLWTILLQAVTVFMILTHFRQAQTRDQAYPEIEALKQAETLVRTQEAVIFGLAKLSDSRDSDTGGHLDRIAQYSSTLASRLRQMPEFRDEITPTFVQLIGISSALHDIGKVGLEDSILLKPSKLTSEERTRMQRHTQIGETCLKEIERRLGSSNFLQMAREISYAHHERWDGEGYPVGLAGEQIPLAARIVAVADVYDALSCRRVYKEALTHEQCVDIIAKASGTHFDPRIVEAFVQIEDRFRQIFHLFHTPRKPLTAETTAMIEAAPGLPDSTEQAADDDFAVAAESF